MGNLSLANAARSNKALNQLYRFNGYGIKSFRQLIDEGIFIRAEKTEKPSVQWNRVKYNRMDAAEQMQYEKKLDTMVPDYRLYTS